MQTVSSTFSDLITANNGITNSNAAITNNSTLSQIGSSTFTGLITATNGIKNASSLLMKADGTQSIYFTTDGNVVGASNCIGRLFGTTGQMYFDFYNNILFRSSTLADNGNNSALNINLSNSTFYGPLTTNAITNNGTLTQSGSASFNAASFTSITNTGILQTNNMELGPNGTTFTYLDMKTTGGNSDYDTRIGVSGGSSTTSGQGSLSFNCASCTIGSNLVVNGTITSNGSNLSTVSDITCLNLYTNNAVHTTKIYNSGPVYMSNDSVIYFKSDVDQYNYIKYDATNSGPQIGFYDAFTIKCSNLTGTDVTTLKSTKTDININVNTTISGSLVTTNAITSNTSISTPIIFSPILNNSKYITIRGFSYKSSGTTQYTSPGVVYNSFKSSFDQTTYTNSSFSFVVPDGCISICSQYSYYTTGTYNFQGITPYYYMQSSPTNFNQNIGTTIGSFNAQPTGSVTLSSGTFNYNCTLNVPSNNNDYIYFTFNIWFY